MSEVLFMFERRCGLSLFVTHVQVYIPPTRTNTQQNFPSPANTPVAAAPAAPTRRPSPTAPPSRRGMGGVRGHRPG